MDSIIQEAIMSMSKAKDIAIVDCINDLIKRDILVFYDQRPTSEYNSDKHILTYKGACLLRESDRIRNLEKEFAAVEQLKAENEKAYDALVGNICGYCWQKMEDEPTLKQTHHEYANQLLVEIAALKSEIEDLKSRHSLNKKYARELEEIGAQLKSKLKIAVEALSKIKEYFCACSIDDEIIPQVEARKALSEIGGEI